MPDPAAPHEGADPDPADLTVRMAGYRVWGLQLAALTRALTGAVDLAEVADEVSTATRAALGSHFAGVALADPAAGTIRFVSMAPLPPAVVREWTEFPLDRSVPASDAARSGTSTWYGDREAVLADYPDIEADLAAAGTQAMVTVPLVDLGRPVGAIQLTWTAPRTFGEEDRRFLEILADVCTLALRGMNGP
jgi:GAF domain-containing protein